MMISVNGVDREATPEEEKAFLDSRTSIMVLDTIRIQRDALLSQSDWTQVADAPVDKEAWASYRQALRDIPKQKGYPNQVVWPKKPID